MTIVPVAYTLATCKKGCGQKRYEGLCCRYDEYKEGSHPTAMDDWGCSFSRYPQSPQFSIFKLIKP